MYEVLCTCITAPLEGLLVDTAKYSENVGHHLVCRIFVIRRMGKEDTYQNKSAGTRKKGYEKSNGNRRLQRHSSADPMRLGDGGKNNKDAPEIPNGLPELVTTFCKTGAANIWFSPLQIRKIPNGIP